MRKKTIETEDLKEPSIQKYANLTPIQVQLYVLKMRDPQRKTPVTPRGLIKDDKERWALTIQGIRDGVEPWFEFFLEEFGRPINHQVKLLGYYPGISQEDVNLDARLEIYHFLRKKKDIKIATLPGLIRTHLSHWFLDYCKYLNRHVRTGIKFKTKKPVLTPEQTPPDDTPPDDTPPDDTPPDEKPPTKRESQAWPAKTGHTRLEEISSPGPEKQVCDKLVNTLIYKQVKSLPQLGRFIIRERYRNQRSDQEISKLLKCSRATVQRERTKAITCLRSQFIEAGLQP
ncbi:MAG: hypothetical protein LKF34_03690 [Acidaminococcaceae bacterium]|nr:hypothetical protein [Acidaminococcaceae bacterium]